MKEKSDFTYEHALNASCYAILGSVLVMGTMNRIPLFKAKNSSFKQHFLEGVSDVRTPLAVGSGLGCSAIYQAISHRNSPHPEKVVTSCEEKGKITSPNNNAISF